MTQLVFRLQTQLEQVLDLVDDPSILALAPPEGATLRDRAVFLSDKLMRTESEPLTIGLLGGTGVGKSTVLNVLAGSEISAASHRRPWTDHILIYRHEDTRALASERLSGIPWREHLHRNDSVGKILLCDLPDFDSIQTQHRERVLGFLQHLDLLVWVASPEKYADQRFHDFLKAVPKARQNFYFLLNKLDLVFEGRSPEQGYEEMATIKEAFEKRLRENGVEEPLVFLISAKDVLDGPPIHPWNQFSVFKNQVFQDRRVKEVTAIKAANLDVEIRSLLRRLGQGTKHLEAFQTVLKETLERLESQRTAWLKAWERTLEGWTESQVKAVMGSQRPSQAPLLGPGYGVSLLMDRLGRGIRGAGEISPASLPMPEGLSLSFQADLKGVESRMESQILRHNLPESFADRAKQLLRIPQRVENLERVVSQTVAWHLGRAQWPSFFGFKAWQGACYFLLLAVFALAVGGQTAWEAVFQQPGAKHIASLILSAIDTLFSSKGLAALGSYVLLNLFFGFRFYRRFAALIERVVDRRVAALRTGLQGAWQAEVDALMAAFREAQEEIEQERSRIAALTAGDKDSALV